MLNVLYVSHIPVVNKNVLHGMLIFQSISNSDVSHIPVAVINKEVRLLYMMLPRESLIIFCKSCLPRILCTKTYIHTFRVSYNNFSHLTEEKQLLFRFHNIKYLQLLRTIIHNEVMYIDSGLKEQGQNPKEYRR